MQPRRPSRDSHSPSSRATPAAHRAAGGDPSGAAAQRRPPEPSAPRPAPTTAVPGGTRVRQGGRAGGRPAWRAGPAQPAIASRPRSQARSDDARRLMTRGGTAPSPRPRPARGAALIPAPPPPPQPPPRTPPIPRRLRRPHPPRPAPRAHCPGSAPGTWRSPSCGPRPAATAAAAASRRLPGPHDKGRGLGLIPYS